VTQKKAKILVEAHHLTSPVGTGLATYARNLARGAAEAGHDTASLFSIASPLPKGPALLQDIHLFDARRANPLAPSALGREAWRFFHRDRGGVTPDVVQPSGIVVDPGSFLADPALAEAHVVPQLARRARDHFRRYGRLMPVHTAPDVAALHASHVIPLRASRVPTLASVHDIIPLRLPYAILDDKPGFHALMSTLLQGVDHVVTVSEHSRRDIIEFFKVPEDRITNTYQAVSIDPAFLARSDDEIAQELEACHGLGWRDYYLFVGAIEPKKNVARLVEAYAQSGTKRPLILAGGLGWQYDEDIRAIHGRRFATLKVEGNTIRRERRVRHLKYVPRDTLLRLLRGARALVFPSLYEGFGLPVLEALALGTPVITSNTSSLPEVAGEAALLVNPLETQAIATAIRTLDADEALLAELGRRGPVQAELFSPARYAERLAALYARVL
jgi:glycosyltransferase involved in cell wall biosynthesis